MVMRLKDELAFKYKIKHKSTFQRIKLITTIRILPVFQVPRDVLLAERFAEVVEGLGSVLGGLARRQLEDVGQLLLERFTIVALTL